MNYTFRFNIGVQLNVQHGQVGIILVNLQKYGWRRYDKVGMPATSRTCDEYIVVDAVGYIVDKASRPVKTKSSQNTRHNLSLGPDIAVCTCII